VSRPLREARQSKSAFTFDEDGLETRLRCSSRPKMVGRHASNEKGLFFSFACRPFYLFWRQRATFQGRPRRPPRNRRPRRVSEPKRRPSSASFVRLLDSAAAGVGVIRRREERTDYDGDDGWAWMSHSEKFATVASPKKLSLSPPPRSTGN